MTTAYHHWLREPRGHHQPQYRVVHTKQSTNPDHNRQDYGQQFHNTADEGGSSKDGVVFERAWILHDRERYKMEQHQKGASRQQQTSRWRRLSSWRKTRNQRKESASGEKAEINIYSHQKWVNKIRKKEDRNKRKNNEFKKRENTNDKW